MDLLLQDLRYALGALRRSPGFAGVAILTLALGIGATTAIFSVVDTLMMRPLPYPETERIVTLWQNNTRDGVPRDDVAPANFYDWWERATAFRVVAAAEPDAYSLLSPDGRPETVFAVQVTEGFFDALGVKALRGRFFDPEHHTARAGHYAVLAHGFWQRRFGGDPAIVGSTIPLDGDPFVVLGVLPPEFETGLLGGAPGEHNVWVARTALLVLMGAAAFVLLIACANVANLLVARATDREGGLAVRLALGADRRRLVRLLLGESLLLGLAGGAVGVAIAFTGVDLIQALAPGEILRIDAVRVDLRVLGFALAVSLLAPLAFGLAPAVQAAQRSDLAGVLKGARATPQKERVHLRTGLVVGEIALALTLLVGAGLLLRSLAALLHVDPGFRKENVLALQVFAWDHNPTAEERVQFFGETLRRRHWRETEPLGARVRLGDDSDPIEIVGVVGDVRSRGLDSPPHPELYLAQAQTGFGEMTYFVGTRGDAAALLETVKREIWEVEPLQDLYQTPTLESLISETLMARRFSLALLGAFAGLALLLAAVGTYGVISFNVKRRTYELGIRMALGACRAEIARIVLRQGVTMTLGGIGLGLLGALAMARALTTLLYDVAPWDGWTFAGAASLLTAVALLASYIPARRATRVDPIITLRSE
ncbi:MAG: ABC transporter permease [Thermoanaerobaculia bacterium]